MLKLVQSIFLKKTKERLKLEFIFNDYPKQQQPFASEFENYIYPKC